MNEFQQKIIDLSITIGPILLLTIVAIIISRTLVFKSLMAFANTSDSKHDDVFVTSLKKPLTLLKCIEIKKNMGWCNDIKYPIKYNKLFKIKKNVKHEKLRRKDYKYDLIIPIEYNFKNPVIGKGSCIFIHLTKNYKPTAGCIGLTKKDFLIMLKIIKKNSTINIF